MFGAKARGDETIRRVTREKFIVRGNTTFRTLDSTTSFLPIVERYVWLTLSSVIFVFLDNVS